MPITLKKGILKYKNTSTGQYEGVDVVAETATSDQVEAIEDAANAEISAIEAKGVETRESIPDDYTALSDEVDELKSAFDAEENRANPVTSCELVVDLPWERGFITSTGENRNNSTDQLFLRTPEGEMRTNNGELLILRISSERQCLFRFYDASGNFTVSKSFTNTHNVIDLSASTYSGSNYAKYRIVINNKTGVSSLVNLWDFYFATVNVGMGCVYAETFGAIGDGETESTNQIQAAIDYCVANGITLKLLPDRTYIVRQLSITDFLNFDGCNATLKGNNTAPTPIAVISVNCTSNRFNGHLENMVIDCDYKSNGILITEDWRRNYSNIVIKNVADGGKGIAYKKGGGNFFNTIRGRYDDFKLTSHQGTALFIEIVGADSSFRDVDYQYYRYGLDVSAIVKLDNVHGYINKYAMYDGSYFMQIRPWASIIANNLYPDTAQSMFVITDANPDAPGQGKQVLIVNGLYTYFNGETDITENDYAQPYVFDFKGGHRAYINVCGAFLNAYKTVGSQKPLTLCNGNREAINLLNYATRNVVMGDEVVVDDE